MRALVVESPHHAAVKEVPYPKPGPKEVTIKVVNVGICGTDFHIFEGVFIAPYPIILGHEFSGVIHEIGEGVTGFQVGDRVSADPSIFCGECENCLNLKGNHCEKWNALGNTVPGSMAEYVAVPAKNAVKLPDSMSYEEAAFIEPMACVAYGMNRLEARAGDRILVFGAGAIGLQLVQSLAHVGASELVVVDVNQQKLDLAEKYGATKGILSQDLSLEQYPRGFDIVVDATGIPSVIQNAFNYMGKKAKFLMFGVTPKDSVLQLDPFKIYNNDWTIIGSMAINHTFLQAFQWIKAGRLDLKPLVSKTISLEETVAFLAAPKDPELLKVQIKL
ncbi:zinc-dependent alcohol dehydrogenase family protein [Paenibacillus alkaliterrae]|uniref:zinc-dependent alcohol dehydrogenase family protein n=1 Tax=Paenibacillus alkaliterrae TaxID=320909 RepID=UPI001F46A201|nr:zinc-dependent alcohol dehydrogenase family protein [Paenibacillus alkaliterrae]MCF2941627.1 zinc-dependent alcohol dehydrogenase family protein [Paenibacillus alkaliterrae]